MVSEYAIGGVIAGVSTAAGSLIQIYRSKLEQHAEDKRIIAQNFASQKAEYVQEMGYHLNRCHRKYFEAVREAAHHNLSIEEFETEYKNTVDDMNDCFDKCVIYLSDKGEAEVLRFIGHLIEAENYLRIKVAPKEELEYRHGNTSELIQYDDHELDYEAWRHHYQQAKNALRNDINDRIELLAPYSDIGA